MAQIQAPEERATCAKCDQILIHGPKRAYPDFCSRCEKDILKQLSRHERGRRFLGEKLKR